MGVKGTIVRGILPDQEDKVADFRKTIQSGSLDDLRPGEFGIVLGADLARSLRVFTGDKVTLIAPQGTVTPAGVVPRLKVRWWSASSRSACTNTTRGWP
jgi:lipoprotein-releasing system permease protein